MKTNLWIIIPCYNEEEVLKKTPYIIKDKMKEMIDNGYISSSSKILFVNDGSKDSTWKILIDICNSNDIFIAINLAHNSGHQNALYAGMMYAKNKCDCIISLDADLQDDIDILPEFIKKFHNDNQIVYGVRNDRSTDTIFKRVTAQAFYKIMNFFGAETVYNHADYRLLSNDAINALSEYKEVNLFLRGMVPLLGFKSDKVYYSRKERIAGTTKYPLKKMVGFALDGITSFSVKPLRIISLLGLLCSIFSVCGLAYALISHFFGVTVPGWTAIVCSIWLLGGIQLLCIGMLGEYIGKIFSEVKQRPKYYIEEICGYKEEE